MSEGFTLDLTDEWTRLGWILHSRISQLSIEITTGMRHSRGSVLASCWAEGLTDKRTKKGALLDLFTMATMMRSDYEVSPHHREALLAAFGGDEKKTDAALRKVKRDAAKWLVEGRPGSEQYAETAKKRRDEFVAARQAS